MSLDIICSSKLTVFLERPSLKIVRFSKQMASANKYRYIFSRQMEAIVYITEKLIRNLVSKERPDGSFFPERTLTVFHRSSLNIRQEICSHTFIDWSWDGPGVDS